MILVSILFWIFRKSNPKIFFFLNKKTSKIVVLFHQTSNSDQFLYRDISGFVTFVNYHEEIRALCLEAWMKKTFI